MSRPAVNFPVVHAHAAGIDVGSRSHWVCAGEGTGCIAEFGVFTQDLHKLADFLRQHGVKSIAMESTGYYWKNLFALLQGYGFEVCLVNAGHVKNARGKKTDVQDCQWLWQLHRAGLLHASFQPDGFTGDLRTYVRHRKTLIESASRSISRMQKALISMNLQLPVVLSDITGQSGQDIIKAILGGERNAHKLAGLANPRCKADAATFVKALQGHWAMRHLFELRQCWDLYHFIQKQINECDALIEQLLQAHTLESGQAELAYNPEKKKKRGKNDPPASTARFAYQLSNGVDLMQVDGIGLNTMLTILSETGMDLSAFPTSGSFTSWLCLCPNNKVTGGKVFSGTTRKNKSKLAYAFRQAANSVGNQKDTALSAFFHRMAYRKGRKAAIMATARKIAITVYNMLVKCQAWQPQGLPQYQEKIRTQKINNIQRTIRKLGIQSNELAFA